MHRIRRGRPDRRRTVRTQTPSSQPSALELTAALLTLAMNESQGAVEVLANALERMSSLAGGAEAGSGRAALEREIALCIESLQFHDRLMQQLTQVRNCLTGIGGHEPSGIPWHEIKAQLAQRLVSDSQRALLELLLPLDACGDAEPRAPAPREGSIELF